MVTNDGHAVLSSVVIFAEALVVAGEQNFESVSRIDVGCFVASQTNAAYRLVPKGMRTCGTFGECDVASEGRVNDEMGQGKKRTCVHYMFSR